MCATNFIRALDTAFLRHGRFDYVIPIGLPDAAARLSIWSRYIPATSLATIDLDALVRITEGFSPADIEYAARRASQQALEKAYYAAPDASPAPGPVTGDYLEAIGRTRATVSDEVAADFLDDISELARV